MSNELASWLESLSDDNLSALLRARPDVLTPRPPSISALATRLSTAGSMDAAVRGCNAAQLATLEQACRAGAELSAVPRSQLGDQATVDELINTGLLFPPADDPERIFAQLGALNTMPAGLSVLDARVDAAVVDTLPADQRAILLRLAQTYGTGHSADAAPDANPARPIPQLIAAGLLERVDASHVRIPFDVARAIRGEEPLNLSATSPAQPEPLGEDEQRKVDESATSEGLGFTRRVADLIDYLSHSPIALNKDGSVGVRGVAALAKELGITETQVAEVICLAAASNLASTGAAAHLPESLDDDTSVLAPTVAADEWLELSLAERWTWLIAGWWRSTWKHWLVGTRDDAGHRLRLFDDTTSAPALPRLRSTLFRVVAHLPGTADDIVPHLRFAQPLAGIPITPTLRAELLAEANHLGVVTGTTATTLLRALVEGRDITPIAQECTPREVDQVIIQADMTVTTPGPLTPELSRDLELMADLESGGLASVYRITESSIRRALSAGRTAEELVTWLARHAFGEVPQAVGFLIADVAKHHGGLRGGVAGSYLRSSDEQLLDEIMTSSAAALFTRLAPTVLISTEPLARVLDILRGAGFHPVAENSSGATVDLRREPVRGFGRASAPSLPASNVSDEKVSAALAALCSTSGNSNPAAAATSVSTLAAAVRAKRTVRLIVARADGSRLTIIGRPVSVDGGEVDILTETHPIRLPVHRIISSTIL